MTTRAWIWPLKHARTHACFAHCNKKTGTQPGYPAFCSRHGSRSKRTGGTANKLVLAQEGEQVTLLFCTAPHMHEQLISRMKSTYRQRTHRVHSCTLLIGKQAWRAEQQNKKQIHCSLRCMMNWNMPFEQHQLGLASSSFNWRSEEGKDAHTHPLLQLMHKGCA